MKHQPRIKGQRRTPQNTALLRDIEREVKATARHFGVSRSFVVAVALADYFKVGLQPRFRETHKRKGR